MRCAKCNRVLKNYVAIGGLLYGRYCAKKIGWSPDSDRHISEGYCTRSPKTGPKTDYRGWRADGVTCIGTNDFLLNPRFDLMPHSPGGFEWGYGGSGPAQAALAILAYHTGDDDFALQHYQEFKNSVIAALPAQRFVLLWDVVESIVNICRGKTVHNLFRSVI